LSQKTQIRCFNRPCRSYFQCRSWGTTISSPDVGSCRRMSSPKPVARRFRREREAQLPDSDPLPTSANGGNLEMNECNKPTKTAHVDCENDSFLSFDCSVGAIRLWADFSVQSKTKIDNRAVNLCSR
jgi:hypothetical protein